MLGFLVVPHDYLVFSNVSHGSQGLPLQLIVSSELTLSAFVRGFL